MTGICWTVHLRASRDDVFALLATDEGRGSFWAERTEQEGDAIAFHFPNGESVTGRVLECAPPHRFSLTYFNASRVVFELTDDGSGTVLHLHETNVPPEDFHENRAGWVSVLLNLKARAEHGVDLRNHDPKRTWTDGFADN